MPTLKDRLDACATRAALSTADLARWFGLAYPTMKSYRQGREPYPSRRPLVEERLAWLEKAVKTDRRFPVPLEVRAGERQTYIANIRRDYERSR